VLGAPVKKRVQLTTQLLNQLALYFGVFHQGLRVQEIQARIDLESITRYSRFHMTGDGDNIHTAVLIDSDPIARDNSYVKVYTLFIHLPFIAYTHSSSQYDLLPDANTAYRNQPDVAYRQTQYGRMLDIYHVMFTHK
jgi:hypothetical protein